MTIYIKMINEQEIRTGEKSKLERQVTPEQVRISYFFPSPSSSSLFFSSLLFSSLLSPSISFDFLSSFSSPFSGSREP